ncbi:hypothetical protein D3C80_2235970 [compost metagenome]
MRTCPDSATPEPDTCSHAMCKVLSMDSAYPSKRWPSAVSTKPLVRDFSNKSVPSAPSSEVMRRDTVV